MVGPTHILVQKVSLSLMYYCKHKYVADAYNTNLVKVTQLFAINSFFYEMDSGLKISFYNFQGFALRSKVAGYFLYKCGQVIL